MKSVVVFLFNQAQCCVSATNYAADRSDVLIPPPDTLLDRDGHGTNIIRKSRLRHIHQLVGGLFAFSQSTPASSMMIYELVRAYWMPKSS